MLRKDSVLFRHRRKIIAMCLVLFLIIGGVFFYSSKSKKNISFNTVNASDRETYVVSNGNIKNSITSSGIISSSSTKNVSSEVSADVIKINANVGDKVKKGDVLVELDKTDYEKNIRQINKQITNLNDTLKSYNDDKNNLYVYADCDGYVSNINVEVGDSVNKNATIMNITNDEYYYITCKFVYNSNVNIELHDKAKVMLIDTFEYLDGEVTYVSDLKELTSYGTPFQTVEIKIKNPGYTIVGLEASVTLLKNNVNILAIEHVKITEDKVKNFKVKSSRYCKRIICS